MGQIDLLISLVAYTYQQLGNGPIDYTKIERVVGAATYSDPKSGLIIYAEQAGEVTNLRVARQISGDTRQRLVNVSLGSDQAVLCKYTRVEGVEVDKGVVPFSRRDASGSLPNQADFYLRSVDSGTTERTTLLLDGPHTGIFGEMTQGGRVVSNTKSYLPTVIHHWEGQHVEVGDVYRIPRAPERLDRRSVTGVVHLMGDLVLRAANFIRGPFQGLREWDAGYYQIGKFGAFAIFISASVFIGVQVLVEEPG